MECAELSVRFGLGKVYLKPHSKFRELPKLAVFAPNFSLMKKM